MNVVRLLFVTIAFACMSSCAFAAEPAAPAKSKSTPPAKARRLEDIRIEGDVPVPQVLFVTARDPRRTLDFGHDRYRRTSLELARTAVPPTRVAVVGTWPTVPHKESAP